MPKPRYKWQLAFVIAALGLAAIAVGMISQPTGLLTTSMSGGTTNPYGGFSTVLNSFYCMFNPSDPSCMPPIIAPATPENTEAACSDGADNDKDGKVNCADPDCAGQVCYRSACPAGSVQTGGGIVNKPNGIIKTCNRGICVISTNNCVETNCNDGVDNDLDGSADLRDYDCPYMDLSATGVEKSLVYIHPNGTASGYYTYYYKVSFKNQGTLDVPPVYPNPPPQVTYYIVSIYDVNNNNSWIYTAYMKAPLKADTTGWFTYNSAKQYTKIKVFVDSDNTHPEPDENNNIATYDV